MLWVIRGEFVLVTEESERQGNRDRDFIRDIFVSPSGDTRVETKGFSPVREGVLRHESSEKRPFRMKRISGFCR